MLDESAEDREAREAISPYAHDLRRAITRAQADYFQPVAIRVPMWFPKVLDDGLLWRVRIERADVAEPELVLHDPLEHTWWIGWRP